MIVPYLRSSSVSTFSMCEHKYFLDYVLRLPGGLNEKASFGSAFHKSAEIIGRLKLSLQEGLDSVDCEELGVFSVDEITDEFAILKGFETYRDLEMPHWGPKELDMSRKIYYDAMAYLNGAYDPRNQNIIEIEKRFDLIFPDEWAHYEYLLPDGQSLVGQLGLKGTVDVIARAHNGQLLICDYKTGQNRKDINSGQLKDWDYFNDDFQILLYMYVLLKLFPEEPSVIFTLFWTRNGGPYTVLRERDDLPDIERKIRDKFEKIRDVKVPKLRKRDWVCFHICSHYKNQVGNKSVCKHFQDEILSKGLDQTTAEYIDLSRINEYTGGGRTS